MAKRFALYFGAYGFLLRNCLESFTDMPYWLQRLLRYTCLLCPDVINTGGGWLVVVFGSAIYGLFYAGLGFLIGKALEKSIAAWKKTK